MLHSSFLITKRNLSINLNKSQKDKLKFLFDAYAPGDTIYPGVLIRELNIDMKSAYQILDLLKRSGYLQELYEIICPNESRSTGIVYDNLLDLLGADRKQYCYSCNGEIDIQKNNILVYKSIQKVSITYE